MKNQSLSDINCQINYLKERIRVLLDLSNNGETVAKTLPSIRNISQEILNHEKRLLDNIVYDYIEKNIIPNIVVKNLKKYQEHIYFPICKDRNHFEDKLKEMKIDISNSKLKKFIDLIESYQPYTNNQWIADLRDWSDFSHRKLIPQVRIKYIKIFGDNSPYRKLIPQANKRYIRIVGGPIKFSNANISNAYINNVPVDLRVRNGEVIGEISEDVKNLITKEVNYIIEGTQINILSLCKDVFDKVKEIALILKQL